MTHPVDAYNHAEYVRSLEARLAEAKGLLEEIGDEWPAVKRTTVERAYAFIERATDSAAAAPRECTNAKHFVDAVIDGPPPSQGCTQCSPQQCKHERLWVDQLGTGVCADCGEIV